MTSGPDEVLWHRRVGTAVAMSASIALALLGLVRGTWSVGGSDSSCYGLMADAFARGDLQPYSALAATAPWPDASLTFAPGGFIPSPVNPTAASPICAPGFAILLAPFRALAGANAIFVVTPLAAAALVWSIFVVARALSGPIAGALAAVLTASAPIVLFQSVQPMNDITTAALIAGVLAAACSKSHRRFLWIGMLSGVAFLLRPNLAPVCVVIALWVLLSTREWRGRGEFALAAAPFVLVVLFLNHVLYGHPLRVGYGAASDLFSVASVAPNMRNYGTALFETQLGLPLVGLLAPVVLGRDKRGCIWLALGMSAATAVIYFLYNPFPEWWYLRFLLPALVLLIALTASVAVAGGEALARLLNTKAMTVHLVTILLTAAVAAYGIIVAGERQTFDLHRVEGRFRQTGRVVREQLPANAAFVTVWQSGTMRYHAGRDAVLWDSLDPAWLDRAVAWLREQEREPFILLEEWEEPLFRQRFAAASALGQLDWPPRYEIRRQARIFVPDDRARYMRGERVRTEYILDERRK